MKKNYLEGTELLVLGEELISAHISWLVRAVLTQTTSNDAIASLCFNPGIPKDIWALFHGPSRSISVNLEQHFTHALTIVQDEDTMYTSLRALILHDLLDSAAHEAWHAKTCLEEDNWANSNLDEEGAQEHAEYLSWDIAELFDVEVLSYGPLLDTLLHSIYKSWKEDCQDASAPTWKKLQLHMIENDANYFNPALGVEIKAMREVFQSQSQPAFPWFDTNNDLYTTFITPTFDAIKIDKEICIDTTQIAPIAPTEPTTPPVVIEQQLTTTVTTPVTPQKYGKGYDPLDDYNCATSEDDEYIAPGSANVENIATKVEVPANPTTNTVIAAAVPTTPVEPTKTQLPVLSMDVNQIQSIADQVLKRMFNHVYRKCDFNTDGGYDNTGAVLDPINISDIEGATDLFVKQDTLTSDGIFTSHADINGMIKGLPSNEGLPRYTFYMNIGGTLRKRIFIAQNPNKMNNGIPTSWALEAKNGNRIMMLIAPNTGMTAFIKLKTGDEVENIQLKLKQKKK